MTTKNDDIHTLSRLLIACTNFSEFSVNTLHARRHLVA